MSLNFDFSNVHDYEEVTTHPTDTERWHPVADSLVWLSLICGFNTITEKNRDSISARIVGYQQAAGPSLRKGDIDIYITPSDVSRFVGLRTNSTPMTDAQWLKKLGQIAMDNSRHLIRPERKSALEMVGLSQQPEKESA